MGLQLLHRPGVPVAAGEKAHTSGVKKLGVELTHFWRLQVNRMVTQPLQGEQDDQEGLSKPGALAISLCTTENVGFGGNDLFSKCQELLQIQPEAPSAGRKGMAISQGVRAENKQMKLRNGKCKVSNRKHFPE